VYFLGLAAAVLLAVGFVVQHHAAEEEPPSLRLSPKLLVDLAGRPRWLLGIAAMICGQILGAAALSRGALTLVEPLLAANVVFALPLTALYHRRRIGFIDIVGALMLVAGLAVFVWAAQPVDGLPDAPNATAWAAAFGAVAAVVVVLLVAQRGRPARLTAALLAVGAGLLFGMQDTLTRTVDSVATQGISALFSNWTPYVLLAVAVVGLLLAQSAFEAAPLAASLPAITVAEPLAGIALGIGLYSEQLATTALALSGEVVGLIAMVCGIVVLARSPLVTGRHHRRSR
jgi:drug/metabolite transporter (DMT)-like permease